jgi:dienelactone hydrolase
LLSFTVLAASCGGGGPAATTSPPASVVSNTTPAPSALETTTTVAKAVAEPAVEEVEFESDGFELAGTLFLPAGEGPHPAVIIVSGSGAQTRASTPGHSLVKRKFLDAGFAVFSWDKPGNGDSTGEFEEGNGLRQRAAILADGIAFLADQPAVDSDAIGLWGLSQAGWVMPLALELTDGVFFMIVVSGGGEDSIEQMGYRIGQELVCGGLSVEEGALVERFGPQAAKGETYELYVEAMEVLLEIPGMERYVGDEMSSRDDWQPWPPEIDAYFDPMDVIEHTTIPVLAVFGEMDRNIDPVQGAAAYKRALAAAGNQNFHVELIPGIGHTMFTQATGCLGEPGGALSKRYVELLDEWIAMLAASR